LTLGGVTVLLRRDLAVLEAPLVGRTVAGGRIAVRLLRRVLLAVGRLLRRILVSAVGRLPLRRRPAPLLLVRRRVALAALGRRAVGGLLGIAAAAVVVIVVRAAHGDDGLGGIND
jgi:hypothetical protein